MDERWRIELLGGLRAVRGERVVAHFCTQKTAALLAYLALHLHRAHARDTLVELFWPEAPPGHGRHSLRQALSLLRRTLESREEPTGSVLLGDRLTIQLNAARVQTDVAEFERVLHQVADDAEEACRRDLLTRAVEVYGGTLLPGLYEPWVLSERERLTNAYLKAVGWLIAKHEAEGDLATAVSLARRAVHAEPLRQESHRTLIRLLTASGRSAEARRRQVEWERILRRERDEATPSSPAIPVATRATVTAPSQEGRVGNLPHPLTRFFGREEEIAALTSLLQGDGTRLLTLTGPGGSGKSRLALEVAWRLAPAWCGRVWQVSLVDLGEAGQIEEAIRDAMGLSRSTRGEPHEQVVAALAGRPTLLLLDNFEHLIGAGTCRLEALLERATGLTALVTSRRRLGLAGEREVPVRPLPIGPAVSLFLDRAAAADPDFAAGPDTPGDVTALCEGLERIPLAIELAAARAAVLTPAQMLAHLSPRSGVGAGRREPSTDHSASTRRGIAPSSKLQAPGSLGQGRPREPGAWSLELGARSSERFQLLVSHRRHDPARHRSLRATLEWSYRLLSPELQRFFARLSVFRGGWTEEAAAAICDTPLARSFLEQLRDASMLQAEEIAGETRYRMLETLREFADEQLSPTEALDVGQRHGRYYLQRAVASEWLLGLEAEIQNLLAALTYFVTVGDADSGLEMAWELFYYWEDQWQVAEGRRHLARLLALAPHRRNQARAHGLQAAGMLASLQGDLESAWQLLTEALALNRELGLERGISGVLACLGRVARDRGDFVRARSLAEESLKTAHRCGDSKLTRHPLFDLAMLEWLQGNAGTARTLLLQRLEIDRALGDADLMADTLSALGNVALQSGDAEEAGRYFEESLAHYRSRGHRPALGWALLGLAAAARAHGDAASAETLCEESVSIRREIGDRRGLAASLQMLGALARDRGDRNSAREFLRESLDIHRALRDQLGIVTCIEEVGALARDAGRPAIATRLFAAASVRRDLLPAPLPPRDQAAREACLMTLHASLGEAAFSEAWEAGSQLAGEQIADVALTDLAALPDTTTRGSALLELTDDRWERVRALLSVPSCNGRPRRDDRHVLDGILYVLGTGSRWRDLPRHYGSPATCWRRLRQWQADGTWQRICELLSLTEVEADALGSVRFGKRPGQRIGERRADNPRTKADDASSPPRTRAR